MLFIVSALLLHVPFAIAFFNQGLEFQPAQFMTEYSKLFGSSLVSVLIAFGWRRYDRGQQQLFAQRARDLAIHRIVSADPLLAEISRLDLSSYDTSTEITKRAIAEFEHRRQCDLLHELLRDVQRRLEALSHDARHHIHAFDRSVVLLADALTRHQRENVRPTAQAVRERASELIDLLKAEQLQGDRT